MLPKKIQVELIHIDWRQTHVTKNVSEQTETNLKYNETFEDSAESHSTEKSFRTLFMGPKKNYNRSAFNVLCQQKWNINTNTQLQ